MRKRRVIKNEWELAIWTAILLGWPGTSLADGALWVLEQVDEYNRKNSR